MRTRELVVEFSVEILKRIVSATNYFIHVAMYVPFD